MRVPPGPIGVDSRRTVGRYRTLATRGAKPVRWQDYPALDQPISDHIYSDNDVPDFDQWSPNQLLLGYGLAHQYLARIDRDIEESPRDKAIQARLDAQRAHCDASIGRLEEELKGLLSPH